MVRLTRFLSALVLATLFTSLGLAQNQCSQVFTSDHSQRIPIIQADLDSVAAYNELVRDIETYGSTLPQATAKQLRQLIQMEVVRPVRQQDALNFLGRLNSFLLRIQLWGMTDGELAEIKESSLNDRQLVFLREHPLLFPRPMGPRMQSSVAWLTQKFTDINREAGTRYEEESLLFFAYQHRDLNWREYSAAYQDMGRAYVRIVRQHAASLRVAANALFDYSQIRGDPSLSKTLLALFTRNKLIEKTIADLSNYEPKTLLFLGSLLREYFDIHVLKLYVQADFPDSFHISPNFWQRKEQNVAFKLRDGILDLFSRVDRILKIAEREQLAAEDRAKSTQPVVEPTFSIQSIVGNVPYPRSTTSGTRPISISKKWIMPKAKETDAREVGPTGSKGTDLTSPPLFKVRTLERVETKLRKIRIGTAFIDKFRDVLGILETNPGELKNPRIPDIFRVYGFTYGGVAYRVLYHLDAANQTITVMHFDTRGNFYEQKNLVSYRTWASDLAHTHRSVH